VLRDDAFFHLFEGLREGLYIGLVSDDASATLAANPHLRLMLGWPDNAPASDVRPFDLERFVDPVARRTFLDQLKRNGAVHDHLLRIRRLDGSAMWIEVTARAEPLPDAVRVEAAMHDVTERKKLEDQARDMFHQLSQAEKLAALGQTMSGVAHELNNPLATVLACAERLTSHDLDPRSRRDLEAIHNAAERAARIVRNLQTFARKRHTTRTMVDLNHVVKETLALRAYEQHKSNIVIVEALAAGLPQVFADPHQIQQVLLNLVINAEHAMLDSHGRGVMTLRSWYDLGRDAVCFEVSDDGPGIPESAQARIFDPFFTTKAVGKGTGLGLTVAYAIAQEHGGRIAVSSVPGGGASFVLELPAGGQQMRAPDTAAAATAPSEVPVGTRALVVEDEQALGEAVAGALRDSGFEVDRAANGEEAIARTQARAYDLIICDLKMPRVDGMAFFDHLAATAPALTRRLVFVTGDVAGTEAGAFLERSGCRWLAKPFRLRDLVRAAREVIA